MERITPREMEMEGEVITFEDRQELRCPAEGVLKVGDIIIRVDTKPIKWRLLATTVKSKKIGDIAYLIVIRDGMSIPITFTMGAMKES
jgi:hypothetical protein